MGRAVSIKDGQVGVNEGRFTAVDLSLDSILIGTRCLWIAGWQEAFTREDGALHESDNVLHAFDPYGTGVYKGIAIGGDVASAEVSGEPPDNGTHTVLST